MSMISQDCHSLRLFATLVRIVIRWSPLMVSWICHPFATSMAPKFPFSMRLSISITGSFRPSVRLSRLIFERRIWPLLRVKCRQLTSWSMIQWYNEWRRSSRIWCTLGIFFHPFVTVDAKFWYEMIASATSYCKRRQVKIVIRLSPTTASSDMKSESYKCQSVLLLH